MSVHRHSRSKEDINEEEDEPDNDIEVRQSNNKQSCQQCWQRVLHFCSADIFSAYTHHHVVVFLLTFFSYSLFHVCRKTFSNVKSTISEEWSPQNLSLGDVYNYDLWNKRQLFSSAIDAEDFLGVLDACFLGAYAVGLYISGALGDRFNPVRVLSVGMWLTALCTVAFGVLPKLFNFYHRAFYVITWLLAGLFQSAGWPTEVAVMGAWFGKRGRGFVLGLWSACASVGNIIGSYLASYLLPYGYEYAFLINGSLIAAGGFVVWFGLIASPLEIGLPDPSEDPKAAVVNEIEQLVEAPQEIVNERAETVAADESAINFWKAILLPGVLAYSLAYACVKLVNYSFFFWLPFYLRNAFHWQESFADQLSTWYDWGGIAGGLVGGLVSDWLLCRAPVVTFMIFLSPFALLWYSRVAAHPTDQEVVMTLVGFLIGGAANLISAAVSADLGRQIRSSQAVATVTGLVDGTGSVGAALGQILVPVMNQRFGWSSVFYLFMIACVLTLFCLANLTYRELREMWRLYQAKRRQYSPLPTS